MSVQADGEVVVLIGRCGVEDSEALLDALCARPRLVDLSGCEQLHTALVQILLAAGLPLVFGRSSALPETVTDLLKLGPVRMSDRSDYRCASPPICD